MEIKNFANIKTKHTAAQLHSLLSAIELMIAHSSRSAAINEVQYFNAQSLYVKLQRKLIAIAQMNYNAKRLHSLTINLNESEIFIFLFSNYSGRLDALQFVLCTDLLNEILKR